MNKVIRDGNVNYFKPENKMRNLVISRLVEAIDNSDGYGIPRSFDCDEEQNVLHPDDLAKMSDAELLECLVATVGWMG